MDMFLVVVVGLLFVWSLVFGPLGEGSLVMGALISREERIEDMFVMFRTRFLSLGVVVRDEGV